MLLGLIGMSRSTCYCRETRGAADGQSLERPVIREICLGADMRRGCRRVASEPKRRTGLCLSPVIDLFNDEAVACSMPTSPSIRMVQELEIAVRDYIYWYNKRRVKMGLKGKSPVEYRLDRAA